MNKLVATMYGRPPRIERCGGASDLPQEAGQDRHKRGESEDEDYKSIHDPVSLLGGCSPY
jgi:hypothetical protein